MTLEWGLTFQALMGYRIDAIKYNNDASLILSHASTNGDRSVIIVTGSDGKKSAAKEYHNSFDNFNIL